MEPRVKEKMGYLKEDEVSIKVVRNREQSTCEGWDHVK